MKLNRGRKKEKLNFDERNIVTGLNHKIDKKYASSMIKYIHIKAMINSIKINQRTLR